MNTKVKLPRNVIDVFRPALGYRILGSLTPIRIISDMYNRTLEGMTGDVAAWLNDYDNQWLLIDAVRYGYETEPEPRWGIKAGNCYMYDSDSWTFTIILNLAIKSRCWWVEKKDALDTITLMGFGEVVDLNKEGKTDD